MHDVLIIGKVYRRDVNTKVLVLQADNHQNWKNHMNTLFLR